MTKQGYLRMFFGGNNENKRKNKRTYSAGKTQSRLQELQYRKRNSFNVNSASCNTASLLWLMFFGGNNNEF